MSCMNNLQFEFEGWLGNDSQFFNFLDQDVLDGLWYWNLENPENGILNDKFWALLGYGPLFLKNDKVGWTSLIDEENLQIITDAYKNHLLDPKKHPFDVVVDGKHKNGNTIVLNLKGTVVYDDFRKPNRFLGIVLCLDKRDKCNIAKPKKEISREQYKNLIKRTKLGIWDANLITGEVLHNERWVTLIGYSLNDLPPMTQNNFLSLVHPDDRIIIERSLDKDAQGGGLNDAEFRMLHKNGEWIWVLSQWEVTKHNEAGQAVEISGVNYDITERKTNELLLEKYKDLLDRSNEAAKIGHWEIDLLKDVVFWSKVIREIHEVPNDFQPSMDRGMNFFIEGENRDRIEALLNRSLQNPTEFEELVRIKSRKGTIKWVRLIGVSEFNNGKCTRIYGLMQDVDEIEKAQQKIRLREEQFRQSFNHSAMGMAYISVENKLVRANTSFCRMYGYSEAELQDMDLAHFAHSGDLELYHGLIEELFQGKRQSLRLDFRFIHKDGSVVWTNSSLSAIHNENGEVMHFVCQAMDITERKKDELLLQHNADLIGRINEVANIGIWEMDMSTNTANWSPMIKEMAGVPDDYSPSLEDVFSFFKTERERDILRNAMTMAKEEGKGFNHVLQVTDTRGRTFWSRTIGISDFENGKCKRLYGFFQDVDKETLAVKELAIKEEELRLTFDHVHYGMAVIGLNGRLQKANRSTTKILGYSEAELRKLSFYDITHPDDIDRTGALMSELLGRKRDSYNLEKRYIHKKGYVIWADVFISAVKNDKGEYLHFVSQIEDITKRKKNDILLLNYKNGLEQSHIIGKLGSWKMDPETKIVFWSDNLKRILEVDSYEPLPLEVYINTFVQEKDRKMMFRAVQYIIDHGEKFDFEIELKTKMGNLKWMRIIGVPEFKNGKCVRLSGLIQDINENKRMQLNLGFSEEIFRRTFEYAAIGMVVINLNGELQKVNPKICEILGYSENELLKKTIFQLTRPQEREMTRSMFKEIAMGRKDNYKLEKQYIHKSGKYVWVEVVLAGVKNDVGVVTHLVSQIQDVSDKKQLTDNLTEHNNRLINFAYIVSHNLRSHTSNISMLLDLAQEDNPKVVENEYYNNVKLVSDSMNDTIYHLNEIVEINSKVSSALTTQNLLRNVKNAVKSIESLVKHSGSKIEIDIHKDINVLAVHAYLESVILNLLTNAIKYKCPERSLEVLVTAGIDGNFAFLSVKDNGMGIDMDRHGSKLFGMYKTFHEHPDARGMGLFLCKNQVEAMGGKIEVESQVNQGTNFITYLRHENN